MKISTRVTSTCRQQLIANVNPEQAHEKCARRAYLPGSTAMLPFNSSKHNVSATKMAYHHDARIEKHFTVSRESAGGESISKRRIAASSIKEHRKAETLLHQSISGSGVKLAAWLRIFNEKRRQSKKIAAIAGKCVVVKRRRRRLSSAGVKRTRCVICRKYLSGEINLSTLDIRPKISM